MRIYYGDIELGSISVELVPVLYYCSRELGLDVEISRSEAKLIMKPGLTMTKILLTNEGVDAPFSSSWEEKVVDVIRNSLQPCGMEVVTTINTGEPKPDLILSISIMSEQHAPEPTLELFCSDHVGMVELKELIKVECMKNNINFVTKSIKQPEDGDRLNFRLYFPTFIHDAFWEVFGDKCLHIIAIGLICKFQREKGISPLSLLPIEFISLLRSYAKPIKGHSQGADIIKNTAETIEPSQQADAYFDYHLFLQTSTNTLPRVYGHLTIKNTGNVSLKNPVICIRIDPIGSVRFTGQIIPRMSTQTMGIQTSEGSKGWRYMNDNWFEELNEKGELWIESIQDLNLLPGEMVTIPNMQIRPHRNSNLKELKVDAFVYFNEDDFRVKANNSISILYSPQTTHLTEDK